MRKSNRMNNLLIGWNVHCQVHLFVFTELVKLERVGSFEKDTWTLTDEEKIAKIPLLKEKGNMLYKEQKYSEAADKYGEAIGLLEQLSMKYGDTLLTFNILHHCICHFS